MAVLCWPYVFPCCLRFHCTVKPQTHMCNALFTYPNEPRTCAPPPSPGAKPPLCVQRELVIETEEDTDLGAISSLLHKQTQVSFRSVGLRLARCESTGSSTAIAINSMFRCACRTDIVFL